MGKDNTIISDPATMVSMCSLLSEKAESMKTIVDEIEKANNTFFDDHCKGKSCKAMKKKASKTVDALIDGMSTLNRLVASISKTSERFISAEDANKASISH